MAAVRAVVVLVALALVTVGVAQAQPGEWCDLPFTQSAQAGGHITWAGDSVYYFRGGIGNGGSDYYIFDPKYNQWTSHTLPQEYGNFIDSARVKEGSASAWAGGNYVYVLGVYYQWFPDPGWFPGVFKIDRSTQSCSLRAGVTPGNVGGALCWTGGNELVGLVYGGQCRYYDLSSNSWSTPANLPGTQGVGACMAWAGGDTVYIMRGGGTPEFWGLRLHGGTTTKPQAPEPVAAGAALVWNGETGGLSKLLLVPGGGSHALWSYDVTAGIWESLPSSPHPTGGASEGALATFDWRADHMHLYALQGVGGQKFRRYGPKVASDLPFDESFEGSYFPPQSWKVDWPLVTRRTSSSRPTAIPYAGNWMTVFALSGSPGYWTGLRTPPLLVGPSPRLARMSFRMYQSPEGDPGDTLYVWRSRDGNYYNTVAAFPRYASPTGWSAKTVNLQTDGADTLYAAFYAHSGSAGDNYNIYIDSLHIWQPSTYQDVGATALLAPTDTVVENMLVTPRATVRNNGTSSASFKVRFRIGSVYADSQQVNSLAPNDSATLMFNSWVAVRGSYVAKCSTAMSGDEDPSNDAVAKSVHVSAVDVGAVRILEPIGVVGYGETFTPTAVVQNFGTATETFTVRFLIGTFYSDDTTATVAAQEQDTVVFAGWTADSIGTHIVRCTTRLNGDADSSNDAVQDSVVVVTVGVEESGSIPTSYALAGARPNPFRSRTRIGYALPRSGDVRIDVFDASGIIVRTLTSGPQAPGFHDVTWDGRDGVGRLVPGGLYFYRLEVGDFTAVRKAVKTD